MKDVSQTRRCFRQPDGRWWLRIDVTAEQLSGSECALPTGFAAYLGLSPGESRTVRSAAGELTMTWHGRPVLETIERLLDDVGAKEGGHLFLTLSDEGVLRARHLPVAAQGAEHDRQALRLVGYTAPGGTREQAARVIATRIGMTGPVGLPDLLTGCASAGTATCSSLLALRARAAARDLPDVPRELSALAQPVRRDAVVAVRRFLLNVAGAPHPERVRGAQGRPGGDAAAGRGHSRRGGARSGTSTGCSPCCPTAEAWAYAQRIGSGSTR